MRKISQHIILCFLLLALPFAGRASSRLRSTYKLSRWEIPKGHYSGITPLVGNRYAIVSDKETQAGFFIWQIEQDTVTGAIRSIRAEGFRGTDFSLVRDAEGICFCPWRQSFFVSGEADQRILEHRLDGGLTGCELATPAAFDTAHIQPNRGFEALTCDTLRRLFWTCTESPLRDDTTSCLQLLCFDSDLRLLRQYDYPLEAEQARNHGRDHYHGVVALTAQADGSLLVLEREARIARHYNGSRCWHRLFIFHPQTGQKCKIADWQTRFNLFNTRFANYEGMCLGQPLPDGRQTLLLIADSQGGYGRGPWHLKDRLHVLVLPAQI